MEHRAQKLVIITEKLILGGVTKIIEDCGATGYTVTPAGGKGSRGVRADRGSVSDAFVNVKIEIIIRDEALADTIADKVMDTYFKNYSGILYLESVEILRPQKF